MNRTITIAAALLCLNWCFTCAAANTDPVVYSLCYHDVRDVVQDVIDTDQLAISTDRLIQHFNWLKAHGYHPVTVAAIRAARAGRQTLPDKPVLLTFDDGYLSAYTKVYPLLKLFNYPAVVALVGSWLEYGPDQQVPYGKTPRPRTDFLSWEQIREMQASGLIEFASHSYDLHRGVRGNPFGNELPAATARIYEADAKRYETAADYRQRIVKDLKKNIEVFIRHGLPAPTTMAWPYGEHSRTTVEIAKSLGMAVSLTLDDPRDDGDPDFIHRFLIHSNPPLANVMAGLRREQTPTEKLRIAQVDMDYLHDADTAQQNRNLSQLLDRIKALEINTVFLQAYADPDGDDNADALYFPNRHLPMRADLYNRVAWQLATRANVSVYAWLPISAFSLPDAVANQGLNVSATSEQQGSAGPRRWSIFAPRARELIRDIYADLAIYGGRIEGLLFHDDGVLGDYEDDSAAARAAYAAAGFPGSIAEIRVSEDAFARWTRFKTQALIAFTRELAAVVRHRNPRLKTARSLFARTVLNPQAEAWFAQNLPAFLAAYDHPIIMAMPYMEQAAEPNRWLSELIAAAKQHPDALQRVVFQLQTIDWRTQQAVPLPALREQFETLRHNGVRHFAYYPDNYIDGHPSMPAFRAVFSRSDFYPLDVDGSVFSPLLRP